MLHVDFMRGAKSQILAFWKNDSLFVFGVCLS